MNTQKILSGLRIGVLYAIGVFTFLLCVFSLSEGRFSPGLFFGIASLWIMPITQRLLNAKLRFPRWVNWVVPISAVLIAMAVLVMSLPIPTRKTVPVQQVVKDNIPATGTVVAAPVGEVLKHPMFAFFEKLEVGNARVMEKWVDSARFFRPISSLSVVDSAKVTAIQKRWIAKTLKDNNEYHWFLSGQSIKLDSVIFTVAPKEAKEWILEQAEETQTWLWFEEYFAMLKSNGLPYLPISIRFVRPKGMENPFHIAHQGWEKAGMAYIGCTLYMGNYSEKTEFGVVKGGVKQKGKKYVVVYRVKEHDEKLYEWPDWEKYTFYYDRMGCNTRNMVQWVKLD